MFVGFIVGLLFGIPKSRGGSESLDPSIPQPQSRFIPNTNLEQISDWLTKILVGVGLTPINEIGSALWTFAGQFSPMFGEERKARSFVICVVIYFVFCGFMSGYFWTRMFLARAFAAVENAIVTRSDAFSGSAKTVGNEVPKRPLAHQRLREEE